MSIHYNLEINPEDRKDCHVGIIAFVGLSNSSKRIINRSSLKLQPYYQLIILLQLVNRNPAYFLPNLLKYQIAILIALFLILFTQEIQAKGEVATDLID